MVDVDSSVHKQETLAYPCFKVMPTWLGRTEYVQIRHRPHTHHHHLWCYWKLAVPM